MRLRGFSFHSVKGGVGKSTLATACAIGMAHTRSTPVVLIDMDLTGTSLADVLMLEAPEWEAFEGSLYEAMLSAPKGFSDRDATWRRIDDRRSASSAYTSDAPPYLNDYLRYQPPITAAPDEDAHPRSLLWRFSGAPDNLQVIPSSALPDDVEAIMPLVFSEDQSAFLQGRLEFLIDALIKDAQERGHDELTLIFDTPPTIPGLSRAVLSLALRLDRPTKLPLVSGDHLPFDLEEAKVDWNACLVMTQDLQDQRALLRWFDKIKQDEDPGSCLRLIVNRVTGDESQIRARLNPGSSPADVYVSIHNMDSLPVWFEPERIGIITEQAGLQMFHENFSGEHGACNEYINAILTELGVDDVF